MLSLHVLILLSLSCFWQCLSFHCCEEAVCLWSNISVLEIAVCFIPWTDKQHIIVAAIRGFSRIFDGCVTWATTLLSSCFERKKPMVLTTIAVMTLDKNLSEFGHIFILWNIQKVWWADMPSKVEGTLTGKKSINLTSIYKALYVTIVERRSENWDW